MPEQVLQTKDPRYKLQKTSEVFSSAPSLVFSQTYSSEMLEHMSCWVSFEIILILTFIVWQYDTYPLSSSVEIPTYPLTATVIFSLNAPSSTCMGQHFTFMFEELHLMGHGHSIQPAEVKSPATAGADC
jgi:hypothetical protein